MANRYLIRCVGSPQQYELQWLLLDESNQLIHKGNTQKVADLPFPTDREQIIVLLPSKDINLYQITLPKLQAKKLQQALPYALEDFIADEIDNCFFAAGDWSEKHPLLVAVIQKPLLNDWLRLFDEQRFPIDILSSEIYALPLIEEKWFALVDEESVWLRVNDNLGFCVDRNIFPTFINLLVNEHEYALPTGVIIKNLSAQPLDITPLQELKIVTFNEFSMQTWLESIAESTPKQWPINFLTTSARKLPDRRATKKKFYWQIAAALAIIWVFISLGSQIAEFFILSHENNSLEKKFHTLLATPEMKSIDPEVLKTRLTRQLEQLQTSAKGDHFLQLMNKIAKAWQKNHSNKINELHYQNNEIHLLVTTPTFSHLERLSRALTIEKLHVEQRSVAKEGSQAHAELLIRNTK